jgi:hypothetical protein
VRLAAEKSGNSIAGFARMQEKSSMIVISTHISGFIQHISTILKGVILN